MDGGTVGPRVNPAGWPLRWLNVAALCLTTACADRPAIISIEELNADCALISSCRTDESLGPIEFICNVLWMDSYHSSDRSSNAAMNRVHVRCLLQAWDCDAVRACSHATPAQAAGCDGTDQAYCVGDIGVRCYSDGRPPSVTNCAAAGLVCGSDGTWAGCGTAPCDPGSDDDRCTDGVLFQCSASWAVWTTRDCAFSNQSCVVSDNGHGDCYDTGEECDGSTFQDHCDGDTAVSCPGGHVSRLDCRKLHPDLTCVKHQGVYCKLNQQCDVDWDATCYGDAISYCLAGQGELIDCVDLGYSGCAEISWSGGTDAYCTE